MRKSQIIALSILFIVVSIIICVGAWQDKPGDNTQNMLPTIPPSTPTAVPTTNPQVTPTVAPPTATPAIKPVVDNLSRFDSYSKTGLRLGVNDKVNPDDEVNFSNSEARNALNGLKYIISNPGTNNTTDIYICIMLSSSAYNAEITEILDFAKANSVKLSFFTKESYLDNSANHSLIKRIYSEGHTLGSRDTFMALSNQGLCDAIWRIEQKYQAILGDPTFRSIFYAPESKEYSQRDIALLNELGYTPVFRYQSVINSSTQNKTYDGVVFRVYMGEEQQDFTTSQISDIKAYITWGLQKGYKFASFSK